MNKAQMNQMFIYLMVIIVVGAVLVIGYNGVVTTWEQACLVEVETFEQDMADYIDTYSEYGAEATVKLRSPCDYATLCFVNNSPNTASPAFDNYETIKAEATAKTNNNIFLVKKKKTVVVQEDMPELVVDEPSSSGLLCIKEKSGQFEFIFRGIQRGRLSVSTT